MRDSSFPQLQKIFFPAFANLETSCILRALCNRNTTTSDFLVGGAGDKIRQPGRCFLSKFQVDGFRDN
jgi:hypothetical protein